MKVIKTLRDKTMGRSTVRLVQTTTGFAEIVITANGQTSTISGDDRDAGSTTCFKK